tara:strand:+ start:1890 stop:2144 length:255 start_codon:yes stop_codon:yes gene_type:complete
MKLIKENVPLEAGNDRTLPNNSYLVTYLDETDKPKYDIAMGDTGRIFDHYYDKYKKKFQRFDQTQGRISPKLWNPNPQPPGKKK